tara:strand:- start:283 stop:498 length:216 start_codon:yes stop_codon:yes gene_type:complete
MVKNFGVPKLNKEQFGRMMNIVFIEGLIVGNYDAGHRYLKEGYRNRKSLNELTKRMTPEKLYQDLIKKSIE